MSKEDPVHHRHLLPSDSVLGEAAPMMHWRTCSVIEWSSPIHWWWNTWTQTFHSCPLPLSKSNPPLLLKIFPIACTEIQTGISAFFIGNIYSCFLLSSLPLGMRSPFLNSPRPFVTLRVLRVCMGMLNAQSMQYSRTLLFFHTCIMCLCKLGFPMYYTVIYCLKFKRPPTGFSCGYLFG